MADEEKGGGAPEKTSLLGKLITLGIVLLVPVILGLVAYKLVLAPLLSDGGQDTPPPVMDPIPMSEVTVSWEMPETTVLTDPDSNSSVLLLYEVMLVCDNQTTLELVTGNEPRFKAMISTLHRNRTQTELNDPTFQDWLLNQTKQEANILLKRLRPEETHEISDVMYLKFTVLPV